MTSSRQLALTAAVLLTPWMVGCGEAEPGSVGNGRVSGPGAAEVICGLACVVVFLSVPVGLVVWLMLRGK